MLTLLGSLLGFGTSFLPKIVDLFQDRQDKAHELALVREQRTTQEQMADSRLELAQVHAASAEVAARYRHDAEALERSWKWIASLSASVRPVTTYWFVGLFVLTKGAVLGVFLLEAWLLYDTARMAGTVFTGAFLAGGKHLAQTLPAIWDEPTMAMFSTIMAFWFGDRCRRKAFGK